MITSKPTVIFLLLFVTHPLFAGTDKLRDLELAYSHLNRVRESAGMNPFTHNRVLETAAFNHAYYLLNNLKAGHYELPGKWGFTGTNPQERTVYVGYPNLMISENVSHGQANSIESIDGLMGAIYHRLSFLSFVNNEVGIGIAHTSSEVPHYSAYVFDMGSSDYATLCQMPSATSLESYYTGICQPHVNIPAQDYENATLTAQSRNPQIVVWPVDNDQNVPPTFFEESPDPLPDYSVSGYPVSVQFNPLTFKKVDVLEFKLYEDNAEVKTTRLLTKETDPNYRLSHLEFALFPLEQLKWDTSYRAEVKYTSNIGHNTLVWHFKTKSAGIPFFTISNAHEVIKLSPRSTFILYVPSNEFSKMIQIKYQIDQGMNISTSLNGDNTLLVSLSGQIGQRATFSFSEGRELIVEINPHASQNDPPKAMKFESVSFLPENLVSLPSLRETQTINAQGQKIHSESKFSGGISLNGYPYQKEAVQKLADVVKIQGHMVIDSHHVGQQANIFVYAQTILPESPMTTYSFLLDKDFNIVLWDQDPAHLSVFTETVTLEKIQNVSIYQGNFYFPGTLKIYFGYRLTDGTIVFPEEGISTFITG